MKVTKEIIFQRNPGSVSDTPVYVLPAYTAVTIDFLVIANVSVADVTYKLHHCRVGTSPTNDNLIIPDVTLVAGKTHLIPITMYMYSAGESIQLRPSTGGSVCITGYGTKSVE
jgi:hypothetical protein